MTKLIFSLFSFVALTGAFIADAVAAFRLTTGIPPKKVSRFIKKERPPDLAIGGSLATQSGVDASHLEGFERGRRRLSVLDLSVIQRALEAAGVEFSAENGGGAGVRLRKAK